MTTAKRQPRRRTGRGERGSAMIIAVMVMLVGGLLAITTFAEALHSVSSTSVDRDRVQAVAAAEAGLDQAFSTLQGASSLPCASGPVATVNINDAPIAASASYTLTYYDAYPPGLSPPDTNCTSGVQGGSPQAVEVTSTGTVNSAATGKRTMQSLVRLIPAASPNLTDAIFTQNSLTFGNAFTINGQQGQGNNASVYLNGSNNLTSVSCPNGAAIYGSVYLPQTGISLANSCHVLGDVWVYGDASASNNVLVDGAVKSSHGNISLANGSLVHGALAAGTVTPACGTGNTNVIGPCASNATVGAVPVQSFPDIDYNATTAPAWSGAGFTRYDGNDNCTSAPLGQTTVYQDIAAMSTVTTPTVIYTTCALSFTNNTNLTTSADLAIFAEGGITTTNHFSLTPADGKVHNLYMIVPYSQAPYCPQGDISLSNNTSFVASPTSYMDVLFYTPCDFTSSQNSTFYGQIYAGGQATFTNSFTENFVPMSVPGVNGASTPPTPTYNAQVAYTRETLNP